MGKRAEIGVNVSINRTTGKQDEFKKIVRETEAFYEKIESTPLEIGVADIKDTMANLHRIRKEINSINSDSSSNSGQIEFARALEQALDRAEDKLSSVGAMFRNVIDGSRKYATGLNEIDKLMSNNSFGIMFVDAEGHFEELENRTKSLFDAIKNVDYGDFRGIDDLKEQIALYEELKDVQKEMLNIDSTLNADDFISGKTPKAITYAINDLKQNLSLLEKSGFDTLQELYDQQERFTSEIYNSNWDESNFEYVKSNIDDKEIYDDSIHQLENYIRERESLLDRIKTGDASNYFSESDIDYYVDDIENQMKEAQENLKVLKNLKGQTSGSFDFSEVVNALNEIKNLIGEIKQAFQPLTDSMSQEGSALTKMLNVSADEVDSLITKFTELHRIVDKLDRQGLDVKTVMNPEDTLKSKKIEGTIEDKYEQGENYSLFDEDYVNSYTQPQTKDLVTKTKEELQKIKAAIDEVFDFSKIDPNYQNIQTITDKIYEFFVDLQKKINSLEFKFSTEELKALSQLSVQDLENVNKNEQIINESAKDSSAPIEDEASKLKEIDAAAKEAAESKKKFAAANKEVKQSAESSADAIAKEVGALDNLDEEAGANQWKIPRNGDGTVEGLNLPVRFIGENGQSATKMFAEVKSEIEELTGRPVTIDFLSKPNEEGQLEAVGATLKYVNEASGVTIRQFYDIKRNEEGIIVATQSAEKAILGAAKAAKTFNTELQQKFALDQVKTLESQMGDLKLDLTEVTAAANNIHDKASLDKFNLELKIAKEQAKQLKAQLKGQNSLDTVAAAEKSLLTLPDKMETLHQKLKDLMGVEGTGEIEGLLNRVALAYRKFGQETEVNKKVDIFKGIINDLVRIQALMDKVKHSDAFKDAKQLDSLDKKYTNLNDSLEKYKNNLKLVSQDAGSYKQAESLVKGIERWQGMLSGLDKDDAGYEQKKLYILQQIDALYGKLQSKMSLISSEQKVINTEMAKQKKAQGTGNKQEEAELNALYTERNSIISNIIKLDKKVNTLKTTKGRAAAQQSLDLEKQRLAVINSEIYAYGDLANKQKLAKQDDRLVERLRGNSYDNYIKTEENAEKAELADKEARFKNLIALQKEYYDNSIKFTKAESGSKEEELYLQRTIDAEEELNKAKKNTALTQEQKAQLVKEELQLQKELESAEAKNTDNKSKSNFKDIRKEYAEYAKAQEKITKIDYDISGKDLSVTRATEVDKAVASAERLLKLGVDVNAIDKSSVLTQEQKNALLADEAKYRQKNKDIIVAASDAETTAIKKEQQKEQARINRQNQNYGKSTYNSAQRKYDATAAGVDLVGITDSKVLAQLEAYKQKLQELKVMRDKFANDPAAAADDDLRSQFNKAALEAENLRLGIKGIIDEAQKLDNIAQDPNLFLGSLEVLDASKISNVKAGIEQLAGSFKEGQVAIKGWSADGTKAFGVMDKGHGVIEDITIALKKGTNEIIAYKTGLKETGNSWEKYKHSMSETISHIKNNVINMFGAHEVMQAFRQGIQSVREIDLAMTELKKVTEETRETYTKFLKEASKNSSEIGTTMKEYIESTSDFARLGYSIEDASELSKVSNIYANVGDEVADVAQASDSIISTMKAFNIEANDAITIVDRFNAVGNHFAITSGGIGDALQRSASALYEAGNTIDESIALITAANSVIQDPDQVGTAMKTLSLRLRGAKVELEESGLEVDGMADSVASLREKLLALTGQRVDIMLNDTTFKSTTQILREMSKVWEDMSDISQAAALELMGGGVNCRNVQQCAF